MNLAHEEKQKVNVYILSEFQKRSVAKTLPANFEKCYNLVFLELDYKIIPNRAFELNAMKHNLI